MSSYPEISDDFGHWLAGYLDGEGCFMAGVYGGRRSVIKSMTVNARADDHALLAECKSRTGLGILYSVPAKRTSRPAWSWVVRPTAECLRLIEILERYPLRSKKRRDFEIWAELVRAHALFKRPGKGSHVNDYETIERLARELSSVRQYRE